MRLNARNFRAYWPQDRGSQDRGRGPSWRGTVGICGRLVGSISGRGKKESRDRRDMIGQSSRQWV